MYESTRKSAEKVTAKRLLERTGIPYGRREEAGTMQIRQQTPAERPLNLDLDHPISATYSARRELGS
jgi:hypothetical protein